MNAFIRRGLAPARSRRHWNTLRVVGGILCVVCAGTWPAALLSAEPDAAKPFQAPACPNAAVIYWTAFAAMPKMEGAEWDKWPAAAKDFGPVPDDLRPLLKRFDLALHQLQRARAVACCDWQLDFALGLHLELEHCQHARQLARAALMRARLRFHDKDSDGALADILAALKLGRDCAGSPLIVTLLIDVAIEKDAIELLSAQLPRLTPEQLDGLAKELAQLPPTPPLAACVRAEWQSFGAWLERFVAAEAAKLNDPKAGEKIIAVLEKEYVFPTIIVDLDHKDDHVTPEELAEGRRRRDLIRTITLTEVQESLRIFRTDYEMAAKIAELDYTEQAGRWAVLKAELNAASQLKKREDLLRLFSFSFLPTTSGAADREEEFLIRRNLLDLALHVQRHGPDVLQTAEARKLGKVTYEKKENGFELRGQRADPKKTVVLRVGTAQP